MFKTNSTLHFGPNSLYDSMLHKWNINSNSTAVNVLKSERYHKKWNVELSSKPFLVECTNNLRNLPIRQGFYLCYLCHLCDTFPLLSLLNVF